MQICSLGSISFEIQLLRWKFSFHFASCHISQLIFMRADQRFVCNIFIVYDSKRRRRNSRTIDFFYGYSKGYFCFLANKLFLATFLLFCAHANEYLIRLPLQTLEVILVVHMNKTEIRE